jgi:hypothetical protein
MALRALIAGVTGHDMEQEITSHRVADATVIKIPELALDAVEAGVLYPDQANDPTAAVEEARELWLGSVDPRRLRTGPEAFALGPAEAPGEFDRRADGEAEGIAEVQPAGGAGLPAARGIPAVLDASLAVLSGAFP